MKLPDQALRHLAPDDLKRQALVRVVEEIVNGLMKPAGGSEYEEAIHQLQVLVVERVRIQLARAELLVRHEKYCPRKGEAGSRVPRAVGQTARSRG